MPSPTDRQNAQQKAQIQSHGNKANSQLQTKARHFHKIMMAYLISLEEIDRTAIMLSDSMESPICIGKQGKFADEHPVANILHLIHKIHRDETILMNYPPSLIELGMMWRAGKVKNAYYIDSRDPLVIKQYAINKDGFEFQEKCAFGDVSAITADEQSILDNNAALQKAKKKMACTRQLRDEVSQTLTKGVGMRVVPQYIGVQSHEHEQVQKRIDEYMIRIVMNLVARAWTDKAGNDKPEARIKGNNIAAIMVDKNGYIIGWGLNIKGANKTFHAETLMIEHYLRENNVSELPDGVTIYTSLECCHMCAGHIAELGKNIRVVYAQEDPYFKGKNALKKGINGCSQSKTTLPYVDIFSEHMSRFELEVKKKNDILGFLFSGKSRTIFYRGQRDNALFQEMMITIHKRSKRRHSLEEPHGFPPNLRASEIMRLAKQFFQVLQQAGVIVPCKVPEPISSSKSKSEKFLAQMMKKRRLTFFTEPRDAAVRFGKKQLVIEEPLASPIDESQMILVK